MDSWTALRPDVHVTPLPPGLGRTRWNIPQPSIFIYLVGEPEPPQTLVSSVHVCKVTGAGVHLSSSCMLEPNRHRCALHLQEKQKG